MKCKACGTENPEQSTRCARCGKSLKAAAGGGFDSLTLWTVVMLITLVTLGVVFVNKSKFARGRHAHPSTIAKRAHPVKSDQRTIGIALETYYIDHGSYPGCGTLKTENAFGGLHDLDGLLDRQPTFSTLNAGRIFTLTTPIAYIPQLFPDQYSPVKNATFCYWNHPKTMGWIVWSAGPDETYDLTLDNIAQAYDPATTVPSALLLGLTYDPSNGISSRGDIYRYKQ